MDSEFYDEIEQLLSEEKYEEVISRITALRQDDVTTELSVMKAHCFSQLRNYRKAMRILESIRDDVAEDDLSFHIEAANAEFGLHHYDLAVEESEICIEIDENNIDSWLLLCLIYSETGDDDKFREASDRARELDEEAWESVFGDQERIMSCYTEYEAECILQHIEREFGSTICVTPFGENGLPEEPTPINVILVAPTLSMDFYKIMTIGFGAYKGADGEGAGHRIELAAFLPKTVPVKKILSDFSWVSRIMYQFAEMVETENTWLDHGHTISYGNLLDESVEYDGVIIRKLSPLYNVNDSCRLPCGENVTFLQMIPLYEEEILHKLSAGCNSLFKVFDAEFGLSGDIITTDRKNLFPDKNKKPRAIPKSALEDILSWEGADGCYATDRIIVDNCRVGFMYRTRPDDPRLDSGWRFMAGDESEAYMENTDNMGIFKLNTICNYDEDIIEYLESPVGSAFYRSKSGKFLPMDSWYE